MFGKVFIYDFVAQPKNVQWRDYRWQIMLKFIGKGIPQEKAQRTAMRRHIWDILIRLLGVLVVSPCGPRVYKRIWMWLAWRKHSVGQLSKAYIWEQHQRIHFYEVCWGASLRGCCFFLCWFRSAAYIELVLDVYWLYGCTLAMPQVHPILTIWWAYTLLTVTVC